MTKKTTKKQTQDSNEAIDFHSDFMEKKVKINKKWKLNEKQIDFLKTSLDDKSKILCVDGYFGTAKTYMAVYSALTLLNEKKVDQIIYLRNPIESSSAKLGYLPGDQNEKFNVYAQPFWDKLDEFISPMDRSYLSEKHFISALPVGFTRGLNWANKAIIVDEAGCLSFQDIFLLVTRMAEGSKLFLIGSSEQNDIGKKSGFSAFCKLFDNEEAKEKGIFTYEFKEESDIVRSEVIKYVFKVVKQAGML